MNPLKTIIDNRKLKSKRNEKRKGAKRRIKNKNKNKNESAAENKKKEKPNKNIINSKAKLEKFLFFLDEGGDGLHWTVGVALATLYEGRLNKSSIGASDDATTLPLAAWQSRAEEHAYKGDEGREQGGWGRGRGCQDSCCHCCRRRCLIFCFRCLCCMFRFASSSFYCLRFVVSLRSALLLLLLLFFFLFICRKSFKCVSSSSSSRAKGRRGELGGAPRQRTEEDTQQFQQQ